MAEFESGMFDLEGSAEFVNMLVYGDSGCGKTVLAGTAPGRKLMLAGEPGYISAARQGAQSKVRLIPDTATAIAAVNWLETGNCNKFDWIVVEGLGTMQIKFLLGYAAEAFDANPAKRAHRNLPDKPDYFNAQNFMKGWVARLIDLPCNVLFTTHAMRLEDDDGERVVYPWIQGKGYEVSNYISGLMHAVGYMAPRLRKDAAGATEQVRRILWQGTVDPKTDTRYFAKDQFDRLGKFMDDTTMPEILERIGAEEVPAAPAKKAAKAAKNVNARIRA